MQSGEQEQMVVGLWDPDQTIRSVTRPEIDYSRGFLRCQLGQWFPGLGLQWLTLTHSMGLEVKITAVEPLLSVPKDLSRCFAGKINQEEFAVAIDQGSLTVLSESCVPGGREIVSSIFIEYLARRFLTSLILAWGGPQSADFAYYGPMDLENITAQGSVTLKFNINGSDCSAVVLLGQKIIDQLDGLWRRQIRSTASAMTAPGEATIEIAQLVVHPGSVSEYTKSGTLIDLEVPVSDRATLRFASGDPMMVRLRSCDNKFVLETRAGAPETALPAGTTRLSVQLGSISIDSSFELAEIIQPGAMIKTDRDLSNKVGLVVNNERIASAKICSYEGRFAISVE